MVNPYLSEHLGFMRASAVVMTQDDLPLLERGAGS